MQKKPELLMPAGNVEMFYAAIEGGANAIYLGLKNFNARGRANNFTYRQVQTMAKIAAEKKVKIYVTLNTIIKNSELSELIGYIGFLSECGIHAVIIQDWGVYHLIKTYFPKLVVHASTQMGNHNSLGTEFSHVKKFERVILARELTLNELKSISATSKVQTEVFIHGALCYSFSGMCLFSSFLGGHGANRGLCAQPCRRLYSVSGDNTFLFNLKDNQQLGHIKDFARWGVSSLKVEGRLKSVDYVYRVAKAYRGVIDEDKVDEAASLLEYDFGREKTDYFCGNKLNQAISQETATGLHVGTIEQVSGNTIAAKSDVPLKPGSRVRIQPPGSDTRFTIKIKEVEEKDGLFYFPFKSGHPEINDKVILTGFNEKRFRSKLEEVPIKPSPSLPFKQIKRIENKVKFSRQKSGDLKIYVRIGSLDWMRKIHLNEPDFLLLNFSKRDWEQFNADAPFIQKFRHKIYIELPRFIPEKSIVFYSHLLKEMGSKGIRNCVISHLSQKLIVPNNFNTIANENVYCFNDAAINQVLSEKVHNIVFPLENDYENITEGTYRRGIVPVYFHPELFYSRMPVDAGTGTLTNDEGKNFFKRVKDGISIVVPEHPVSLLQYKNKLMGEGFRNFLLDISYDKPSKNLIKKLITRLHHSEQVQPSENFNFKAGLK